MAATEDIRLPWTEWEMSYAMFSRTSSSMAVKDCISYLDQG